MMHVATLNTLLFMITEASIMSRNTRYDGTGNMLSMRTGMSSKTASNGAVTRYTYDRYGNTLTND